MKVYTYSEARQQLATVLEQAGREGGVRIRRRDGQVFVLRPERTKTSPLDVSGLNLRLTRKEIVEFVRAGRRPALGVNQPSRRPARKARRATS
jgi:PHD/YefM family antitoxin component YafN of YafNO toxin-antitoxin module